MTPDMPRIQPSDGPSPIRHWRWPVLALCLFAVATVNMVLSGYAADESPTGLSTGWSAFTWAAFIGTGALAIALFTRRSRSASRRVRLSLLLCGLLAIVSVTLVALLWA
jgi:hypothetical protein